VVNHATSVVNQATSVVNHVDHNRKEPGREPEVNLNSAVGTAAALSRRRAPHEQELVQSGDQQAAGKGAKAKRTADPETIWIETTFRDMLAAATTPGEVWELSENATVQSKGAIYKQDRPELLQRLREAFWTRSAELGVTEPMYRVAKEGGWDRPEALADLLIERHGKPRTDAERRRFRDRWYAMVNGQNEGLEMLRERG
jgi:hypothetical protein